MSTHAMPMSTHTAALGRATLEATHGDRRVAAGAARFEGRGHGVGMDMVWVGMVWVGMVWVDLDMVWVDMDMVRLHLA